MSGVQGEIDRGSLAASRIAADPAFSALDSSGAPIIAASGDPLKIVYLNASARAVFGEDAEALGARLFRGSEPGARRLSELVELVRHGAALRLERLRFDLADAPQTITILCRKLAGGEAPASFVIAALGVRPASSEAAPPGAAPESPDAAPQAQPSPASPSPATLALRASLTERHGARAPRFLWKTDAAGRFIDVTQTLADVAGEESADILGRKVEDVVARFGLDPAFAQAIAREKSWSGIDVDWPIGGAIAWAPTTLGALPRLDANRRFAGFQGYGVLHLSRAFVAPGGRAAAEAAAREEPAARESVEHFSAGNVVVLRPAPRQEGDARSEPLQDAIQEALHEAWRAAREERQSRQSADAEALSAVERENFEEIARALRAGESAHPEGPGDDPAIESPPISATLTDVAAELGVLAPSATLPDRAGAMTALLDNLPMGVMIARGSQTLFANRTLLDYLGYADLAAFEADGGLARMFFGRFNADPGARAAAVQSIDGEALDVEAHLQSMDWEGAPATLVTLRRSRARLPGPEESALALARERDEKLVRARADNGLLRAILEASGTAVAVIGEGARIESATGAFAALFDGENGAFDGLPLAALFAPEESRGLAARLAREGGEPLRLSGRASGKAFDVRPQRLGPGQTLCVLVNAAASNADALEAARDAAEQASAAKSDFLARISHEIRTPLNAIIGFAEVMMDERFGPIGSERYKEYLRDVHASGAHVLSLVNDLLDLSKIEAGKMELEFDRVDANAVISECASIMQTQANQGRIVMRLSLEPQLPPIRADARSLKQILLNLLSNAVKFNEPGGQVIVSSALTETGHVVIRVKDTGIGMSDDDVATALEPFKQVANAHRQPGTGLGLPLTKALIEANHASFTIKSRTKEGTLIEIAFPPPQVLAAE